MSSETREETEIDGRMTCKNYLGLDGFRFGWVAAWIDERGDQGFDYSPSLMRLLAIPHARAMIDMPIGLNASGYRACDLRARELIGPSVFLGARRDLWAFHDMAAANRHYWKHEGEGRGVSAQLWNIRDKMREVDEAMTPARQATIGEAHPELIFWNLAGRVRLEPKTSPRGREQRIALLRGRGFTEVKRWLTLRHGTGIGRDDLIDACACAVAARDSTQSVGDGRIDPRGLRMEINF
ncbi:putative RNase H-like nuclease [Bradyrhizobium yuanmingense]|uniref:RNase H-like nuclease n=2 Tax=Nitrobacteraceae TaxID=41294 RepID=A0ABV4GV08_9BRAD